MPDLKLDPPLPIHATPPPQGPHASPVSLGASPHVHSPHVHSPHVQSPLLGAGPPYSGGHPLQHLGPLLPSSGPHTPTSGPMPMLPAHYMMPLHPGMRPLPHPQHPEHIIRQAPFMGQPDFRVHELNKRLQQRPEEIDNLWWDAFATEFFEDDANMTLSFCLEDGPKRYTIGRTLIPRYFRSVFEGGVTDMYFILRHAKESFHNTTITLDCDQAVMVTHHGKPMFTKVVTEGRLILEFTFDDMMRIRSWHFAIRQHKELIPRNVIAMQQDPTLVEQLSKNITRQGLTNYTLNFLRLCVILEPMQELMSRHRAYGLSPRDCLKTTLFQKWQRMVAPPESNRTPNKRRKRKASTGNSGGGSGLAGTPPASKKRSPGPQCFTPMPGDVMVVGEPTLMGGEFGDEDERLITRLENTQYGPGVEGGGGGGAQGGLPDELNNSVASQLAAADLAHSRGSPNLGSPWNTKHKPDDNPHIKTEK